MLPVLYILKHFSPSESGHLNEYYFSYKRIKCRGIYINNLITFKSFAEKCPDLLVRRFRSAT